MTTPKLGQLERVNLRDVWAHEAGHFTPWLAQPSSIALLGEVIGMELEVEAVEQAVGPFRADILCKDVESDRWVLVENQLERTNHTHLGQLVTYAASLKTAVVVWIAERFTDEHRAALDWLNQVTNEDVAFFGLEVEVWRIGASLPAPRFNIMSAPNNWSKRATTVISGELSETRAWLVEFWELVRDHLLDRGAPVRPRKPQPKPNMYFSLGYPDFRLYASVNSQRQFVQVCVICRGDDAKRYFDALCREREAIEAEFGAPLEWDRMPHKIESRIRFKRFEVDPRDREEWPEIAEWIRQHLDRLHEVFASRIKKLSTSGPATLEVDPGEER